MQESVKKLKKLIRFWRKIFGKNILSLMHFLVCSEKTRDLNFLKIRNQNLSKLKPNNFGTLCKLLKAWEDI